MRNSSRKRTKKYSFAYYIKLRNHFQGVQIQSRASAQIIVLLKVFQSIDSLYSIFIHVFLSNFFDKFIVWINLRIYTLNEYNFNSNANQLFKNYAVSQLKWDIFEVNASIEYLYEYTSKWFALTFLTLVEVSTISKLVCHHILSHSLIVLVW